MDTLPVEILARIFGYCDLESAVSFSQSFRAASGTWAGLDASVARQLVLERAPWFVLSESGTGLTSWTKCALATVSRTNATRHSLRGWSVIKEETARHQICGHEDCRFKKPVEEKRLVRTSVFCGTDVVPEMPRSTTKVRHANSSVSVSLLAENEVFLHIANSYDRCEHNVINKGLCSRDEDGTWVVANNDFLDEFVQVTLLPISAGALLLSFFFHDDLHVDPNTPLRVDLFHVPPSAVPDTSLETFGWQQSAIRVGPKIYLEVIDAYYTDSAVDYSLIYNGYFFAMLKLGHWVRFWIDLKATASDEYDPLLSVNARFPVMICEQILPHVFKPIRCNREIGLERYFVFPARKISWVGDLLTGATHQGETPLQSQTEPSHLMAPFFSRTDTNNPGFYKWPVTQ